MRAFPIILGVAAAGGLALLIASVVMVAALVAKLVGF